jgi:hypothetical protein
MSRESRDAIDAALWAQIDAARGRTLAWLETLQADRLPAGVSRISAAHDAARWPGMLLPGTYNAVLARALLGGLDAWTASTGTALADWLLSHRRADGVFRIPGMADDAVFKKPDPVETWRYIDFHVTNYALGALEVLDALTPATPAVLDFIGPWLDPLVLKAWLSERDLRDPWQEGNNIVNLGSFLLLLARQGDSRTQERVRDCLSILFDWHDRLQEPATGFWGVGQLTEPLRALHAMAGSMHNFHLWYATGRPLPFHDRAVDWSLAQPARVDSACIDVDLVDLLVHAHLVTDHRRGDIERWLRALLPLLLAFQNADGGFCDTREGVRRQDGWVRGYEEPQGLSNTFATWFRWIAIAMIADCLWPGRWPWRFRRMVGIGYRKPVTP